MKLSNKLLKTMAEIRPEESLNDNEENKKFINVVSIIYSILLIIFFIEFIL